jgi:uncharacterized protein YerC
VQFASPAACPLLCWHLAVRLAGFHVSTADGRTSCHPRPCLEPPPALTLLATTCQLFFSTITCGLPSHASHKPTQSIPTVGRCKRGLKWGTADIKLRPQGVCCMALGGGWPHTGWARIVDNGQASIPSVGRRQQQCKMMNDSHGQRCREQHTGTARTIRRAGLPVLPAMAGGSYKHRQRRLSGGEGEESNQRW